MNCCHLSLIVFVLWRICIVTAQMPLVNVLPQSASVFEGSGSTEFRCNFVANSPLVSVTSLVFLLDGKQPTTEMKQNNGIVINLINDSSTAMTIEAAVINNDTHITCQSVYFRAGEPEPMVLISSARIFLVQGVLSPPFDLVIAPVDTSASLRKLSWSPPFTLDIPNVDPDIIGYRVCFCLLMPGTPACTITQDTAVCSMTQDTSYHFLNFVVNVQLMVTALNQAGESNFSSEVHQKCEDEITISEFRVVDVIASSGGTYSSIVQFEQPPDITCYDVYSILVSGSDIEPLSFDVLIPTLVDTNTQILELSVMDRLPPNRNLNIRLDASSQQGVAQAIFSTYDVQSVNISPILGTMSIEVGCTFATNTLAMGCQLTVCRRGDANTCMTPQMSPASPRMVLPNLQRGTYTIAQVVEIEQDLSEVIISEVAMLGTLEAILTPTTTTNEGATVSANTMSPGSLAPGTGNELNIGAIAGAVVGVLVAVIALSAVALILVFLLWRRKTRSGVLDIKRAECEFIPMGDGIRRTTNAQSKLSDVVAVNGSKPEFGAKGHRPTSPFYTDVMKDNHSTYDSLDAPPQVPPKKEAKQNSIISGSSDPRSLISQPQEFRVQLHNLSQEDIHEVHLSKKISTSKSDLTYVELDHHHTPVRKPRTSSAATKGVLYSEIKVKEIPPVLPRKKRNESNGSSCISVDRHSAGSTV